MKLRRLVSVAAAVSVAFGVANAHAVILDEGETLSTSYAMAFGGANLSATITYSYQGLLDADSALFSVNVMNTTALAEPGTNRLVGFAVDTINPEIAGFSDNLSTNFTLLTDANFPGGIGNVELCGISGSGNNCSGGANGGLGEQESELFTVTFDFESPIPSAGIEFLGPFAVRFQSAGTGDDSIVFQGCPSTEPGCPGGGGPPVLIAEPSTLALLGLGLLGAGLARRRIA